LSLELSPGHLWNPDISVDSSSLRVLDLDVLSERYVVVAFPSVCLTDCDELELHE